MSTNTPFRALFLPPADPFAGPGQRPDIDELRRIVGRIPAVPTPADLNTAAHQVAVQANAIRTNPDINANISTWITNTVAAFKRMYLDHPNPGAIYFILSPEFAMNGYKDNPADPVTYSAAKPFPIAIEDHIRESLFQRLYDDERIRADDLRIVIALSFTAYENIIVPPGGSRATTGYTVVASNSISVFWKDGPVIKKKRVHKREPCPGDGGDKWESNLFAPKHQWSSIGSLPQSLPGIETPASRVEHMRVKLSPWEDGNGKNIYISFSTCYDLGQDLKHGDCNLCVYVGAGVPSECVKDTIHPYLLHDTLWLRKQQDYDDWVAAGSELGGAPYPRLAPTNKPGFYVCAEPGLEEIAWLDIANVKHVIAPGAETLLKPWDILITKWYTPAKQLAFAYVRNMCRVDATAPPGTRACSLPTLMDGLYARSDMCILPNRRVDKGGKTCSIL